MGKMNEAQEKLQQIDSLPADQQQQLQQAIIRDVEHLQGEVELMEQQSSKLKPRDQTARQAMTTTVSILTDRLHSLQQHATDRSQKIQQKEQADKVEQTALAGIDSKLKDLQAWLERSCTSHNVDPQDSTDESEMKHMIQQSQDLQGEVANKLQELADLSVQIDQIREHTNDSSTCQTIVTSHTQVQNLYIQFKLELLETLESVRESLRETEKRKKLMSEYETNMSGLTEWFGQTRSQDPTEMVETSIRGAESVEVPVRTRVNVQELPRTEILEYQDLLKSLTASVPQRLEGSEVPGAIQEFAGQPLEHFRYHPSITMTTSDVGEEDAKSNLAELNKCWTEMQQQVSNKDAQLSQALEFQQKYQDALDSVSGWLDSLELRIFSHDSAKDLDDQLKDSEDLYREIQSLQNHIVLMQSASQQVLVEASSESQSVIQQTIRDLQERVKTLEAQAKVREEETAEKSRQLKRYQQEVELLRKNMKDAGTQYQTQGSLDQQLTHSKRLEEHIREYEQRLGELTVRGQEIQHTEGHMVLPPELDDLHLTWQQLKSQATQHKMTLQRNLAVHSQYEKMLHEYAEYLDTAQNKLKSTVITAADVQHLKQQQLTHKEFFEDLESHRMTLDGLASKADQTSHQKYLPTHTRLTNLTLVIQDKAAVRGQNLEQTVNQWEAFQIDFSERQQWLRDIEKRLPKTLTGDESVNDIKSKMAEYEVIEHALAENKPKMYHLDDCGRKLLQTVRCPQLESEVVEFAEQWMQLTNTVTLEYKRLESVCEQWDRFDQSLATLQEWLSTAVSQVEILGQLSPTDATNIHIVQQKVKDFLEFHKEVDRQQPLKKRVHTLGTQLLHNTSSYTNTRAQLDQVDSQWTKLMVEIKECEERMHNAQIQVLPSVQALKELMLWIEAVEKVLRDDKHKTVKNLNDVKTMLHKYKGIKIDVNNKQLTVEFIQQSSLQASIAEGGHGRDKIEQADRLGELHTRWQQLSIDVTERLKNYEMLQVRWEEYEKSVSLLQTWFTEQEQRIRKFQSIGHQISIQHALKQCKSVEEQLRVKEGEIDGVKVLGTSLQESSRSSPSSLRHTQATIDKLNTQWAALDHQVCQLENTLEDVLRQWDSYNQALKVVTGVLTETEYTLGRYTSIGGEAAAFQTHVLKVQELQQSFNSRVPDLEKFEVVCSQLIQVCEPSVKQSIQRTSTDIQSRWSNLTKEISGRLSKFQDVLSKWQKYEEEVVAVTKWLQTREQTCQNLLEDKDVSEKREENLQNSKQLLEALQVYHRRVKSLAKLSSKFTSNMESSTIISITSRENDQLQCSTHLQDSLTKHIANLKHDITEQREFNKDLSEIDQFLDRASGVLGVEDPNASTDMDIVSHRLQDLTALSCDFGSKQLDVNALNTRGYRLQLTSHDAIKLQDLNTRWSKLYTETIDKCKCMQGHLLLQQSFTEKCETWMTFLAETERDLAVDIAGDYNSLLEQQRTHRVFCSEMYSRQQILHSIIGDGQKIMQDGDVDNRIEFQRKLTLLEEQWHNVARRANQRKALIDNNVNQWEVYYSIRNKLNSWLMETRDSLRIYEFTTASVQKIRTLIEHIKITQNDIKMHHGIYKKLQDVGKYLLDHSEKNTEDKIQDELDETARQWTKLVDALESKHKGLEGILQSWSECEVDIDDTLTWLKDMRRPLSVPLPDSYDDLQRDLQQCKEIKILFENNEEKKLRLKQREQNLSQDVGMEDMSILSQRLVLLNKQWVEMFSEVSLRIHRINDRLNEWTHFNERYKELCASLGQMESKVSSNQELHIETLLRILQVEYKQEINQLETSKNDLITQGQSLKKCSSEIRANDIEYKITNLNDKWRKLQELHRMRVCKLQETLQAVQQLEVNMAQLRIWLAGIEHKLGSPVEYQSPNYTDIQQRLQEQQEHQNDIEKHSTGVASVLNLCEVLLHDKDACATEVEASAIQQAMSSLDKRWKNICALSMQRRLQIQETWRLWQTFHDDYTKFEEWLCEAEKDARNPRTAYVTFITVKDELKTFEGRQRKLHEKLSKLELLNKQYRNMAREGRTDTNGELRQSIQEANRCWDALSFRLTIIMKRLKHTISMKDDWDTTRETTMSLFLDLSTRLSNLETLDHTTKLQEIKAIQTEIDKNHNQIVFIYKAGEYMMQKSEPLDAVNIQAELDHFHMCFEELLLRVKTFQQRLLQESTAMLATLEDDSLTADAEAVLRELIDSPSPPRTPNKRTPDRRTPEILVSRSPERPRTAGSRSPKRPMSRSPKKTRSPERSESGYHIPGMERTEPSGDERSLTPEARRTEPTGAERSMTPGAERSLTPGGMSGRGRASTGASATDSLDWDMYDIERTVDVPTPPDAKQDTTDFTKVKTKSKSKSKKSKTSTVTTTETSTTSKTARRQLLSEKVPIQENREQYVEVQLQAFQDSLEDTDSRLAVTEQLLRCSTPVGPEAELAQGDYAKQVTECQDSIDRMKLASACLKQEAGLSSLQSADTHVDGIVQRWELLHTRAVAKDDRLAKNKRQWSQFMHDLGKICLWLDEAEAIQGTQHRIPSEVKQLEITIKRHK
ncbi:unnamed protein product, partial [Owenia fusiformis]